MQALLIVGSLICCILDHMPSTKYSVLDGISIQNIDITFC